MAVVAEVECNEFEIKKRSEKYKLPHTQGDPMQILEEKLGI